MPLWGWALMAGVGVVCFVAGIVVCALCSMAVTCPSCGAEVR